MMRIKTTGNKTRKEILGNYSLGRQPVGNSGWRLNFKWYYYWVKGFLWIEGWGLGSSQLGWTYEHHTWGNLPCPGRLLFHYRPARKCPPGPAGRPALRRAQKKIHWTCDTGSSNKRTPEGCQNNMQEHDFTMDALHLISLSVSKPPEGRASFLFWDRSRSIYHFWFQRGGSRRKMF